jgi:O-antigen/teichoic acid export membrane protein
MALFSSELIILLFGRQYETAGIALTILAFGNLVNSSTGYVNDILKSNGFTRTILYINVANLIANVILNILLIPRYGINGAAMATASSTIILNILLLIQAYRYENIHPFSRKMIYSVIAGAASLAITYLVFKQIFTATPYWALIPAGILFYLVYLVVFIRIGGLTDYDREILLTIGRKAGKEELVEKAISVIEK